MLEIKPKTLSSPQHRNPEAGHSRQYNLSYKNQWRHRYKDGAATDFRARISPVSFHLPASSMQTQYLPYKRVCERHSVSEKKRLLRAIVFSLICLNFCGITQHLTTRRFKCACALKPRESPWGLSAPRTLIALFVFQMAGTCQSSPQGLGSQRAHVPFPNILTRSCASPHHAFSGSQSPRYRSTNSFSGSGLSTR